jgi:hypothetical protein
VFNKNTFAATKVAWTDEAQRGLAFPSEIEQLMDWAGGHMVQEAGKAVACGVFLSRRSVAEAICEVVITRQSVRSKWIKLLRVRLRPSIDDALNSPTQSSPEIVRKAVDIFVKAIVGLLDFGEHENASTIKIYGRTRQQLDFLKFLGIELYRLRSSHLQISMEGKFLVVRR